MAWSLFHEKKVRGVKRTYLLLEILVGLSLMASLLMILFSFLAQNLAIEKKTENARTLIFERQYLQTRLQDLFISLGRSSLAPSLYTQQFPKEEKESLITLFDNGIDPDPAFSGQILGRLFLDENHNLCLVSWPLEPEKKSCWRKEILLSNVSDFSLEFLGEKTEADPKIKPIKHNIGWHPRWPKQREDLPGMIRLTLIQNEIPIQFAFRLATPHPIATYLRDDKK